MLLLSKTQKNDVSLVKHLSKWFEIRLTIKLFGRTILDYKWPPDALDEYDGDLSNSNSVCHAS